jgi:hypothetical protein
MNEYSDAELMTVLGSALAPTPAMPDWATLARLHETLAELASQSAAPTDVATVRPKRFEGMRRRLARRTWVVALISLLATGGVATAAVATDTLPGPTRNLAYDLGLPVTSPGLYQAQANLVQLRSSIDHGSRSGEVRWGRSLQHDLKALNDSDLAQIRVPALTLLSEAGLEDPLSSPVTSSATTTTKPTSNDNSDSSGSDSSSIPTTSSPEAANNDSSDANPSGASQLIPTLTVPSPTDLVTIPTSVNDEGYGLVTTTTTSTSPPNSDQVPTLTLPPLTEELSNGD